MSNKTPSVNQTLRKAKTLAKKGDLEQAEQLYRVVLEKFPKNKGAADGLMALERSRSIQPPGLSSIDSTKEQINDLIALYNQGKLEEAFSLASTLTSEILMRHSLLIFLGS